MSDKPDTSDAEWREKLTPEQYHVLREAGTERAFTGKYDKHYDAGEYYCAGCGQKLFESDEFLFVHLVNDTYPIRRGAARCVARVYVNGIALMTTNETLAHHG